MQQNASTLVSRLSSRFSDIPFSVKLTVPSIIMILLVSLLGASVRDMVQKNLSRTTEIVQSAKDTNVKLIEKNFKGAAKLGKILNGVQQLNGTFFELLALQSNHSCTECDKKLLALKDRAKTILLDLNEYKDKFAEGDSVKVFQGLADDVQKYYVGKNNDGIFDVSVMMMQIDMSLILQGMENYQKTFNKLQEEIETLSNKAMQDSIDLASVAAKDMEEKSAAMDIESKASIQNMTILFLIGALLSIVFAFVFAKAMAAPLRRMATSFGEDATVMIKALSQSSSQMEEIAQKVNRASSKTFTDSEMMAKSVFEARENVQTVAVSSEQLAQSSSEISAQIVNVAEKANRAASEAEITHEKVKDLNEIADHIGDVVNSIRAIAEQTNLLALNATIEAARAGAAGKGFAVVADEVKKLAVETSEKTEEIGDRVMKIQGAVKSAVDAVDKIIVEVRQIDQAVSNVSGSVEEQSAATMEINRNVSHASERTSQVMDTVSTVIESANENEKAAGVVLQASGTLSKVSSNLKENTQQFILEILRSTK